MNRIQLVESLQKLSDEELRRKLAGLCGFPKTEKKWRFKYLDAWSQGYHSKEHAQGEMDKISFMFMPNSLEEYDRPVEIPYYSTDRNAIHELIKSKGDGIPVGNFNIAEFVYCLAEALGYDMESVLGDPESCDFWSFMAAETRDLCIAVIAAKLRS